MNKKFAFLMILTFLLVGTSSMVLKVQKVEAAGTVYIKADGSIDPQSAPINTTDAVHYMLTGDIEGSIIIERHAINLDGGNHKLKGNGTTHGITCSNLAYVEIENFVISGYSSGLDLSGSHDCRIRNNNISSCQSGVFLSQNCTRNTVESNTVEDCIEVGIGIRYYSSHNTVFNNTISHSQQYGISMYVDVHDNIIKANNIEANDIGMSILNAYSNQIYHNDFVANFQHVEITYPDVYLANNTWDDLGEGNFWSGTSFTDDDLNSIGDDAFVIGQNNTDYHPLMGRYSDFQITFNGTLHTISTISNSSIERFTFSESRKEVKLDVSGIDYSIGFCRIAVPKHLADLLWEGEYLIRVDGNSPIMNRTVPDENHLILYFTYFQSEHEIVIIPESPLILIASLFTMAALLSVELCRRKRKQSF